MKLTLSTPIRRVMAVGATLALVTTTFGSAESLAATQSGSVRAGNVAVTNDTLPSIVNRKAIRISVRNPNSPMSLSIGLPIRNEASLNRFLATEGVTHGAMTHGQFDARFGATEGQAHQVVAWASMYGLKPTYVSQDGLTISLAGATRNVEAAFHTPIGNYTLGAQHFYANASNPVVPARLGIQTILGLNSVRDAHRIASVRRHFVPQCPGFGKGANCYTPRLIRAAYDVSQHQGSATGQSLGFTLWGAPENQSDFNLFSKVTGDTKIKVCAVTTADTNPAACGSNANNLQFVVFDAKAANKDNSGLGEVAMDIEYAHGIATGVHMKYFMGGDGSDADLATALSAAENDKSLHLISNSWGGPLPTNPSDPWLVVTSKIFKAADAVGTTFLFSTGDQASDSGCQGRAQLCGDVEYPAASPYVLAVGGTNVQLNKELTAWGSEVVWDNWQNVAQDQSGKNVYSVEGGGSGCTTAFSRPSYQNGFPNLSTNASCKGRAIPDVAADGDPNSGVLVVDSEGGKQGGGIIGGTSLATPLWGGMMADTLNFESKTGATPFWKSKGFLTPQLYSLGKTNLYNTYFHDVVCGYNGSPADIGWDQATGLGSPDWYALTQGIAGKAIANTGKAPSGCHLVTAPVKAAEQKLVIPQAGWPASTGKLMGGPQPETWLDTKSFFALFKSKKYSTAGAVGNTAEEANFPVASDATPSGLWLATDYNSSTQADRVVKDTVATGKAKYKLNFVDCSNGYSVAFPGAIPNNEDILTSDCQLLVVSLKDSSGNTWDATYWIYAVGNTVGEMLVEAPAATVKANAATFYPAALQLALSGVEVLNAATSNDDPGPLPAIVPHSASRLSVERFHTLGQLPVRSLHFGSSPSK